MIGFSSDMQDAHVSSYLQSKERSFSSSSEKHGLVPNELEIFEPADPFDLETIPLLEPFGLFCYLNLYNLISISMQLK